MNFEFDQYQRYKNTELIINSIRNSGEKLNILEVGSNNHKNLEKFLPSDNIKYLDIELPEELLKDPSFIKGDATNLDMADSSFDVIVALDVFEHIPSNLRDKFISELSRVSSKVFIICAPFYHQELKLTEERINLFYKTIHGHDFIWLKEHIEYGLPNLSDTLKFMDNKNILYKTFSHGSLYIWEKLMRIHFMLLSKNHLQPYRLELNRFYNSEIFNIDYTDNAYRSFIIGAKESSILEKIQINTNPDNKELDKKINKILDLEKSIEKFYFTENLDSTLTVNHKINLLSIEITNIKSIIDNISNVNNAKIEELLEANTLITMENASLKEKIIKLEIFLNQNKIDPDSGNLIKNSSFKEKVYNLLKRITPKIIKKLYWKFLKKY